MSDYWYEHRDELFPGCVCELENGILVRLDMRIPGDGTDWYCDVWINSDKNTQEYEEGHWSSEYFRIHPSDIKNLK